MFFGSHLGVGNYLENQWEANYVLFHIKMEIGTNEYEQTPTQGNIASEKDVKTYLDHSVTEWWYLTINTQRCVGSFYSGIQVDVKAND